MTVLIAALMLGLLAYVTGEKLHQLHVQRQAVPETGTVTVTLTLDTTEFEEAMRNASRAVGQMARGFDRVKAQVGDALMPTMQGMGDALASFAQKMQVWRAGVEAKWWTRGALYASLGWPDECVNNEVQRALTEEFLFPTQAAAAFLRGWVEYRPDPDAAEVERLRALPLNPHPMYDELAAP